MRFSRVLSMFAMVGFVATMSTAAVADDGEKVFKKKCKTCHSTGTKKILGPGLAGVGKRHSTAWLTKWISDPQGTWVANDADVQDLKKRVKGEKRKKTKMKVRIKPAQVKAVVAYIETL